MLVGVALRKLKNMCEIRLCNTRTISIEFNSVVDDLTSNLIQTHSCKRDLIHSKTKMRPIASNMALPKENSNNFNLDELFVNAAGKNDMDAFDKLISDCKISQSTPSKEVVAQLLVTSAFNGTLEVINKLKDLYEYVEPEVLEANAFFNPYLAEGIWRRGNIAKSLDLFEETYTKYEHCRCYLRTVLNHLFLKNLAENSETHLKSVIAFSERLAHKFGDMVCLITIWQVCFLSEWFSDQCVAMDLMDRNKELFTAASKRFPLLVRCALDKHKTEKVYRLLEFLLKKEAKLDCALVLQELFSYKCNLFDMITVTFTN